MSEGLGGLCSGVVEAACKAAAWEFGDFGMCWGGLKLRSGIQGVPEAAKSCGLPECGVRKAESLRRANRRLDSGFGAGCWSGNWSAGIGLA